MTNPSFSRIFGGAVASGGWVRAFLENGTHTFTQNGTMTVSGFGGGGGGAQTTNSSTTQATGGNSPPWGRKTFRVKVGDVLSVTVGAGGLGAATVSTNGAAGGDTVISLNGTPIMTCQGAAGGVFSSSGTATPAAATATVIDADLAVPGLQAGTATGAGTGSGGAALDVLQTGLGRSPNSTSGAALGGSVATNAGGDTLAWIAYLEFGIAPGDGSTYLTPGRGGGPAGLARPNGGFFAGGSVETPVPCSGGRGGGGGAGRGNAGGPGGRGYAFVSFTPEE